MEIFITYGIGSIILISFLFAIVHYKTVSKTQSFVEISENDSLTENQRKQIKIRPLKSYYYSREMPIIFIAVIFTALLMKITWPELSLFAHQVVLQIGFLALFYHFKPSFFLDRVTIIISNESITGTSGSTLNSIFLTRRPITFPV